MHIDEEIDLVGMVTPLCFLYLKKALEGLKRGEVLQVLVGEAAIAQSIEMIIERSSDHLVDRRRRGDIQSILIRKG